MELKRKLAVLADAAKYDASCASSGSRRPRPKNGVGNTEGMGICHSYTPDGRCVSLLKVLLTNYCIYDCQYCVNRQSSDVERARFSPAEVVRLTLDFYRRNYIEGLFLSSGVLKNPDYTMEQLIAVATSLREEHGFGGYIHLKAAPGVAKELLVRAGRVADRVSVNVELPTERDLERLAPEKKLREIEAAMGGLRDSAAEHGDRRATSAFLPAGQSTQLIVGATETSDARILSTSARLYQTYRLRRVYYSGFSPIPHGDPRLPAQAPPLLREHRLYEADWLLRFYGFGVDELTPQPDGNLSLELDPKLAWALAHREFFPVDVNSADRRALLRIPGVGVKNVQRLLALRRHRALRLEDLKRLRVALRRAAPFIVTADPVHAELRRLDAARLEQRLRAPEQLSLFDASVNARSGQL